MRRVREFAVSATVGISLLSLSPFPAVAEDSNSNEATLPETVVTARRVETPLAEVGRAVAVRTAEDFETQGSSGVIESLQTVSGVRTVDVGGPGAPGTSVIEIRGFRNSGTQLLLNGMRLEDPSSISGSGESLFSYLSNEDLRSVEVLKGANSALYGSDGQAGSVNLRTWNVEEGLSARVVSEAGSFGTRRFSGLLNAGEEQGGVVASVSRTDSEGIDTHGDYENTTTLLSAKYNFTEEVSISPIVRRIDALNDLDTSPALDDLGELIPALDTAKNRAAVQHLFYGATLEYLAADCLFDSKVSAYVNQADRDFRFAFSGFESVSYLRGDSFNVDWQNSLEIPDWNSSIVSGIEYSHAEIENESDGAVDEGQRDSYAVFLTERLALLDRSLLLDVGGRLTHVSSVNKTLPTLEASALYSVRASGTKLHTSIAQGFRAPTLFESDGDIIDYTTGELVSVGNKNLDEEKSLSFDAGVTQALGVEGLELDVTYFLTDADETIQFDFANETHVNGGGGNTSGVETALVFEVMDALSFRTAYTYLAEAEGLDGNRRQRRPYHVGAASVTFKQAALTLFAELRYRSAQELEFYGTADRYEEDGVATVHAAASYALSEELEAFVRAGNIFDEDYTEAGFAMPGAAVFGGVRVRLG